jgi:hypothetical protein
MLTVVPGVLQPAASNEPPKVAIYGSKLDRHSQTQRRVTGYSTLYGRFRAIGAELRPVLDHGNRRKCAIPVTLRTLIF